MIQADKLYSMIENSLNVAKVHEKHDTVISEISQSVVKQTTYVSTVHRKSDELFKMVEDSLDENIENDVPPRVSSADPSALCSLDPLAVTERDHSVTGAAELTSDDTHSLSTMFEMRNLSISSNKAKLLDVDAPHEIEASSIAAICEEVEAIKTIHGDVLSSAFNSFYGHEPKYTNWTETFIG